MTYRFESDFILSYFDSTVISEVLKPYKKVPKKKNPVIWVASNCHSTNSREDFVKQLMKYINVDSYGKCLNNIPYPDGEFFFFLIITILFEMK